MSISNLQWHRGQMHEGLTESNMLANALLTMPDISKTLHFIKGAGAQDKLTYLTMGAGRMVSDPTSIGNAEYKWSLIGELTKPIDVSVAAAPSSDTGKYNQPFTIGFAEKYFSVGDVLASDSGVQIRVQSEPYQNGGNYIYTCQLVKNDTSTSLNTTDGGVGAKFSYEYNAFEEGSQGGGSKQATPMWFKNQIATLRGAYGMTGDAATDVMFLQDPVTKSLLWQPFQEWQFERQWDMALERYAWYAQFNQDANGNIALKGQNGRPVRIGAGVLDQISPYGVRYYARGTEQFYRDLIGDAYLNSGMSDSNKKFIAFTGRGGWEEFQRAMKDSIFSSNIVDTHFVGSNGENLRFGNDVVTYRGIFNTELTVMHLPMLDDETFNRKKHPKTGYSVNSYDFIVLDFSSYGGEQNISMICKKGRENITFYNDGASTPFAGSSNGDKMSRLFRSNNIDGWYCNKLATRSVKVLNPTSCIYARLSVDF